MDDSPEVFTLATGGSMDLVMDSVGLSGHVVQWRTMSFLGPLPEYVGPRSCRGLASRRFEHVRYKTPLMTNLSTPALSRPSHIWRLASSEVLTARS